MSIVSGACRRRASRGSARRWLAAWLLLLVAPWAAAALPIEYWRTSNGVPVQFVATAAIPMLDVAVTFDAGSRRDPPRQAGLADMVAHMLDKGAGDLDEEALADAFARLGAELGGGAAMDRASVTIRTLTDPATRDRAIGLTARVIAAPRFDATILARERARASQALAQSLTQPAAIAWRRLKQLTYPHHPYGWNADVATIEAIDVAALRRFHEEHYVARGAAVAMIGAIDRAQAEAIAERLVGGLPAGEPLPELPPVGEGSPGADERVAHPAQQAHIMMGMPVLARSDPDYFALYVGNYVLGGGGFVSRLYDEVREKRGLAYSVASYFIPRRQPGPFVIGLQTRRDQAAEALAVVRATLRRFVDEGPGAEELKAAQDNLVGGFALRIDSNARILGELALIGSEGLPLDWLDRWPERVQAVTLEQVRDAFRRRIDPDRLSTVVVGDPSAGAASGGSDGQGR